MVMRHWSFLIYHSAVAAAMPAAQISGDWVAKQIENRDTGKDAHLEMEMRLYDHRGRETTRRLAVFSRRDHSLDKIVVRFTYPGDIRDTAFLALENPQREDDRFLYLPAIGRTRRISAQQKQDSFVGSDLTYEDISGRRLDDYTYSLLGRGEVEGKPTYILESLSKDDRSKYPRTVSWVDQETFMIHKAEIYDRAGEKAKEYEAGQIEQIDGIWTAQRQRMRNLKQGTRTLLLVTRAQYNRGIPPRFFDRQTLERRSRIP